MCHRLLLFTGKHTPVQHRVIFLQAHICLKKKKPPFFYHNDSSFPPFVLICRRIVISGEQYFKNMQRVQFLSYGPNQWNCSRAQLTISLTGMKVTTEQHNNKSKSLFNKILTFVLTYQLLLSQNERMNACTHGEKHTHTQASLCRS